MTPGLRPARRSNSETGKLKRSTSVLGAVLALPLVAQPAWADPQSENQAVEAPVRVASHGDGGMSSATPADGGQTATGSEGATQVGSVGAEVPVSVLSNDGDDPDTTGGADGAEVVEEGTEAGVGTPARVLDRGIREAAAATGSTTDGTVTAPVHAGVGRSLETSLAALRGVASGAAGSSPGGGGAAGSQGSGGLAEPPDTGGIGDTAVLRDEGGASPRSRPGASSAKPGDHPGAGTQMAKRGKSCLDGCR